MTKLAREYSREKKKLKAKWLRRVVREGNVSSGTLWKELKMGGGEINALRDGQMVVTGEKTITEMVHKHVSQICTSRVRVVRKGITHCPAG